jgi:hypothetical protein
VIWIENQELLGAQTIASLSAAWQRAERHKTGRQKTNLAGECE